MPADVLSTVLMKMKLRTLVSGAVDAGGDWAFSFPGYDGLKLYVILKGECWLSLEGDTTRYHLRTGDCCLLTQGRPFVIASDLSVKTIISGEELLRTKKNGSMTWNGGGDSLSIGAYFQFEGHLPQILFRHLPPAIHIPKHLEQAAILRRNLEQFAAEFRGDHVGRSLALHNLAPLMLLQIFRTYLASTKRDRNWLVALADPHLSKAMEAIHFEYHRPWSLEALARVADLSRSGFALKFKDRVGIAPMDYLTNWRMQIAGDLLLSGSQTVSAVALAVGYESESAFSAAFKKIIHCRPGSYQKSHTLVVSEAYLPSDERNPGPMPG